MGHLLRTPLMPPGEDAADHPIRLSLYSLPVPKQFVESLGRVISFAQSATCRTWQSAHFVHPVDFGSILGCRSPAFFRRHEVSLLPIYGKQIRYHLPRYGKFLTSGEPVTAIFAGNDPTAHGVSRALREYGLKIPSDISVVGCND